MAKTPQDHSGGSDPDLLAAVVLHTLVVNGREGMSAQTLARECERDPAVPDEQREVDMAIEILLGDGLARREGELFAPTRAAIRANELSF